MTLQNVVTTEIPGKEFVEIVRKRRVREVANVELDCSWSVSHIAIVLILLLSAIFLCWRLSVVFLLVVILLLTLLIRVAILGATIGAGLDFNLIRNGFIPVAKLESQIG